MVVGKAFLPSVCPCTPFNRSTVSRAGPTLKKSTMMNVGAFPYIDVQFVAASPRLPTEPDGALVFMTCSIDGNSMPLRLSYRKWFMRGM